MNDIVCVELWRLVAGIIMVFLSGSAGVMFAFSSGIKGLIWFILGGAMGATGILLILTNVADVG